MTEQTSKLSAYPQFTTETSYNIGDYIAFDGFTPGDIDKGTNYVTIELDVIIDDHPFIEEEYSF